MAEKEQRTQAQPSQVQESKEEKGLLDQIIEEGRMARDESQKEWAKDLIASYQTGHGRTMVVQASS
jgi:type VI secretion system protein ImpC